MSNRTYRPLGRPKGIKEENKRQTFARHLLELLTADGPTQLQIMMATAHKAWRVAQELEQAGGDKSDVLAMMMLASKEAAQAAPYVHPKLAPAVHRIESDDSQRDSESIRRELAELDRAAAGKG
jgi:hypothetical protein